MDLHNEPFDIDGITGNISEDGINLSAIDITNDYMFAYVMRNPEICIELLEHLLPGCNIQQIKYIQLDGEALSVEKTRPETQKTMTEAFDKRGVRLDAYLDDGKTIYNIEMQTTTQPALAKRARLYQAHIDINQLERGLTYDRLRPSFVIFICKFDPFEKGLYRYTFCNLCKEENELDLQDESYKVFFNTMGHKGDISPRLKELLCYMNNPQKYPIENTASPFIRKIEQAVDVAKKDDDWRRNYMTYLIHQRDAELRGEQRGIAIGEKRGAQNSKKETAKKMLQHGMPMIEVAKWVDLSLPVIQDLKDEITKTDASDPTK